jgi:hypothetical protein
MSITIPQTGNNDFKKDLAYSLEASQAEFWDRVYAKAFVDLRETRICDTPEWQRKGVDRFIYLTSGRVFAVDEKVRRKVYDDIFLEIVSIDTTGAPGWIEKDLCIDYLAYAFMPIERVYLFPWPMLRRAWLHYRDEWKAKYGILKAPNGTYRTLGVPVPLSVVRTAVHTATIIQL